MYIFPASAGLPASTNAFAIFFDFFPASLNANPLSPPPITTTPSSSLPNKSAASSPNSTVLQINPPLSSSNTAKGPFQLKTLAPLIFSLYNSIVSGPNSGNIYPSGTASPIFIIFLYTPFSLSHASSDAPFFNPFTATQSKGNSTFTFLSFAFSNTSFALSISPLILTSPTNFNISSSVNSLPVSISFLATINAYAIFPAINKLLPSFIYIRHPSIAFILSFTLLPPHIAQSISSNLLKYFISFPTNIPK